MKRFFITLILFCSFALQIASQNDYIVATSPSQDKILAEEEQFIRSNFPLQILCKWVPGIKFMFLPSKRDMLVPLFSNYDTEKEVSSSSLKQKIFTFTGTEEKTREIYTGTNYSTRFIFECDGQKYFHEIKNTRLDEICEKNPRACINGLVYLNDVDAAKDLLIGKKVYIQSENVRIDDSNSYSGYKEITIPTNTEAIITAVGVGSQSYPVKVIFTDTSGNSYYIEIALSRTNSGLDMNNFQAEKKMKYFSNAVSFTNKKLGKIESLKNKYEGLAVYPKKLLAAKRVVSTESNQSETQCNLPRYTILFIKDIQVSPTETIAQLSLQDKQGNVYKLETDLKYDIIVRNDNYIEDYFGFGDIHKKYPGISEARWQLISRGELETGMNADECRLSIGNPVEIQIKKDSRFETWYYNGITLDFESGTLKRFQ